MRSLVDDALASCQEDVGDAQGLCYATRGSELQKEAADRIRQLQHHLTEVKETALGQLDEDSACILLAQQALLESYACELKMWIAIKADQMDVAWESLVHAQMAISAALRAHSSVGRLADRVERLHAIEHLIFPPMLFSSIGGIVSECECSICGRDYRECEHIAGRPYRGRMCSRIIKKMDLEEISIVKEPANKLCRVSHFTEGGVTRDCLTLREITGRARA